MCSNEHAVNLCSWWIKQKVTNVFIFSTSSSQSDYLNLYQINWTKYGSMEFLVQVCVRHVTSKIWLVINQVRRNKRIVFPRFIKGRPINFIYIVSYSSVQAIYIDAILVESLHSLPPHMYIFTMGSWHVRPMLPNSFHGWIWIQTGSTIHKWHHSQVQFLSVYCKRVSPLTNLGCMALHVCMLSQKLMGYLKFH